MLYLIADLGQGARDARTLSVHFFIFVQFLTKVIPNNGLTPPPREILEPALLFVLYVETGNISRQNFTPKCIVFLSVLSRLWKY